MASIIEFLQWLANTELAFQIGATWWFPLLESVHVLAVVVLVGNIMLVDLRLLSRYAVDLDTHAITAGHLPFVWTGFVVALATGLALFITRPLGYAENPAMQIKMALLLIAGINLWLYKRKGAVYQRRTAAVSLACWLAVVLAGRWIGHLA